MKVTIEDVAKEAGVSIATVSRVMNNNYPVSVSTRKKVEEAVYKLNYTPDFFGKGLMQKKTNSIGVLVPNITNPYFPQIVEAIEQYMREKGFIMFLCDTNDSYEEEKEYIKNLMERHVDGIISVEGSDENRKNGFFEEITTKIPFVVVNGHNKGINCNFVLNNQEMGAMEALEYLIGLGHKDILFLRRIKGYSYDIKEQVYKDILYKHGIAVREENILKIESTEGTATIDASKELMFKRLQQENVPTAVFACNDLMAIGALYAAKKAGMHVPKDISIIGHDNIMISEISDPKLTTVDLNMYELGMTSAKMLFEEIENNEQECRRIILDTHLIKRDSCTYKD